MGVFYVNTVMCSSSHGTALKCVVVQQLTVQFKLIPVILAKVLGAARPRHKDIGSSHHAFQ